jgi:proteasome assembly chaperone (PAC2) family protein
MDGGDVATGTVGYLIRRLDAQPLAEITSEGFYILNMPGMMEVAALFRPHVRIKDGLIQFMGLPTNSFYYHAPTRLILFVGREPNLCWDRFAESIFQACHRFSVRRIYTIGSVSSLVPHSREPRLLCTVSSQPLRESMQHYGVRFTEYEGPASTVTYLTYKAPRHGIECINLIATIPAYVQGSNPRCIEAMTRRLVGMLQIELDLSDLRAVADEFERRVGELVQQQPELAKKVSKLEEDYDNEVFESELGDLKQWLEEKGIRLD